MKTLEFLNSRRPDLEIKAGFIHLLTAYENRLIAKGLAPKTSKWTELFDKTTNDFENEELLLRNTYLNAQMGPFADFSGERYPDKAPKVKWIDEMTKNGKPLSSTIETKEIIEEAAHAQQQELEKKPAMIVLTKSKPTAGSRNSKNQSETAPVSVKSSEDKGRVPQLVPQLSAREKEVEKPIQSQNFVLLTTSSQSSHTNPTNNSGVRAVHDSPQKILQKAVHSLPQAHSPNLRIVKKTVERAGQVKQPIGDIKTAEINAAKEKQKDDTIKALLMPKYNNFVREGTAGESKKEAITTNTNNVEVTIKSEKATGMTQIINQNNINNFIINNPQKIEVIEFSPAKAQLIPELKPATLMRFQHPVPPQQPQQLPHLLSR